MMDHGKRSWFKINKFFKKISIKKIILFFVIITSVIVFFNFSFCKIGKTYKFRFTHELKIGSEEVNDITELNNFKHIRTLGLYRWKENNFEFLKSMSNLEDLTITASGKYQDLNWISDCKNLKVFYSEDLSFDNLNYFSKMDNLQWLHISMSHINSIDGLDLLPDSLQRLELSGIENTESLYLNNFKYLTEAKIIISSIKELSLDSLKNLKRLDVSFNLCLKKLNISDNCSNIEVLEVDNCKQLELNFDTIKKLHSLKKIRISVGQISESEIQKLKTSGVEVEINDWCKM